MDTKTTISITEARKRIFDIVADVQSPHRVYTLTEKGKPKASIISSEELESLMETIEVLRIFPNLDAHMRDASEAVRTKNYKNYVSLGQLEENVGFVHKIPKTKHAVSRQNTKKSK